MLEILRLKADIEKDAAVYKVLVNLEDRICEEVCACTCIYHAVCPSCINTGVLLHYLIMLYYRWKKKQENLYAIQLRHKEFL